MNKSQLLTSLKKQFPSKIVKAFAKVPREDFVPKELKSEAYLDTALPLEQGATISQPCTIASMLSLLELNQKQKILEIGSGCGYVLALLAEISQASEIYGIEILKSLAESSKENLSTYKNITIINKNGSQGLNEKAPFDRILISASADKMPEHLFQQLKDNGILVTPVNNSIFQIKKQNNKLSTKEFPGFVFVPLINTNHN
ncbi:MAG: protein-L-isoaspartate(D-aspartate) O-methyltransferase [Nanoarchaeota archaeon]|nr:protein-L-isoaspartate(D-aspartate) O-methyltransferase [Nanoarchaeota archaeon]MBU1103496.1 protein-L-isoaspartate(D-aspartate) O-methyltransferase [Nanoarchaeota archaeon]